LFSELQIKRITANLISIIKLQITIQILLLILWISEFLCKERLYDWTSSRVNMLPVQKDKQNSS